MLCTSTRLRAACWKDRVRIGSDWNCIGFPRDVCVDTGLCIEDIDRLLWIENCCRGCAMRDDEIGLAIVLEGIVSKMHFTMRPQRRHIFTGVWKCWR